MKIPVDDKTIQARKKIAEVLALSIFDKEIKELHNKICYAGQRISNHTQSPLFQKVAKLLEQFNQLQETAKEIKPGLQKTLLNDLVTYLPEIKIDWDDEFESEDKGSLIEIPCFPYAIGLAESKLYELLCKFDYDSEDENDDVKEKQPQKLNGVRTVSMSYIEEKRLIKLEAPEKGCRVLYFDSHNKLKHAGIVMEPNGEDSIIRSRWGELPAVFTHKLGYVPDGSRNLLDDYGTDVKFYKPLSTEESEEYFHEFLKSRPNLEINILGKGKKSVELLDLPPTKKERDELTIDKLYREKP